MTTLFRRLIDEQELRDPRAFLPRFREQARLLAERDGDVRLATLEPAVSTFEAWYYGQRLPNRDARRVLVAWFGHSMERLWAPVGEAAVASRGGALDLEGADLHEMRRGAAMAARRARDFALGAEQGQLGDETLGYLQDEARRITEQYPRVPLPTLFDDLAAAQGDAFRLIEGGRARPSQMRQLHVMATLLSWHMAKACHDLGDESSAMMHARAAGVSAEQAEHPALSALVHGLKSLISYWSGRSEDALFHARRGAAEYQQVHGTVSVWLPSLEARAAALLGDAAGATAAVEQAARRREAVEPDDLDELGGLLTFPPQKELYYRVETQVLLGHGATGTATGAAAEQAVAAFSDPDAPYWAFGDEAGARCNLAVVRLHDDELDGTVNALRPVLDLPPAQRNRGIVVSAQRVHRALGHSPARTSHLARQLREEITQYAPATPPATALPR
ncbi:hypothetical protein STAN_7104 [Streptomyces sp. CBMAI 2042]|uniref:hypothetical protein n=1 Tax=Streptomyces sp. CBMAI 2042 TaxID=2305222 RepID=UPI000F2BF657|nr:hypothetical protein [Streptomyces sp. CBMAI 2042]RLV64284.1 hypothetical protein STAN_7104 [Streptomyces sp. CBMAI 2042]